MGEEELGLGEGGSILQVWTDPGLAAVATFFMMLPENPDLVLHPNYSYTPLSSILGVPGFARSFLPPNPKGMIWKKPKMLLSPYDTQKEPWSMEGRHPCQHHPLSL